MPQDAKSDHSSDHVSTLENYEADSSDPAGLTRALSLAVDYRGDVTITRTSGGEDLECFIFDIKHADDPAQARIRAMTKSSDDRIEIPVRDVAAIRFTGKDTAAGKSFDTWMKKYVSKKLSGERASIESETLE